MILSLAPMCYYPPHDSASLRVFSLAQTIYTAGYPITIIGRDFIWESAPNRTATITRFAVRWRSKPEAILRALCTAGHYNEIKHTNHAWEKMVRKYASKTMPDVIIVNFIWTINMVEQLKINNKLVICDTHNSEWRLYGNYIMGLRNPIKRWLAQAATARYDTMMSALQSGVVLTHIANADLEDHQRRRPDLTHLLVPCCVGLTLAPGYVGLATIRFNPPDYTAIPKQLLFTGALSNTMNLAALEYFAREFWPRLNKIAKLTVAGSNPSTRVAQLCDVNGWKLEANFDSAREAELYNSAHFFILPFEHGTCSKLKLLGACSRGVHVLTTHVANCGDMKLPSFVTVSDSALEWYCVIKSTQFCTEWAREATTFNNEYAPTRTAAPLFDLISNYI